MKRCRSLPLLLLLVALSCSKKVTHAGGLELILMSDLSAADLTRVHLEISQEIAPGEWHKVFDREQLVSVEVSLPTTASIEAGDSPNQGALIVFTGLKESLENGRVVARKIVQRVVQTQVPTDRVAELKILLTVPCVGSVTACNFGESCQPDTGACGSNVVDSSTLPTYDPGGESPGTNMTDGLSTGNAGTSGVLGGVGGGGGTSLTGSGGQTGQGGTALGAGGGVQPACAPPKAFPKAVVTSDVLSDFEGTPSDAITAVSPAGRWFSYQDVAGSMITPATGAWMVESPGAGGTGSAVHVRGTLGSNGISTQIGAGVGFSLSNSITGGPASGNGTVTRPTDVSSFAGISFYAKSSIGNLMYVQFATPGNDPSYCTCTSRGDCGEHFVYIGVTADWTQHTVKFADLQQRVIGVPVAFDPSSLLTIKFAAGAPVPPAVDFWIDDVTLIH